MLLLQPPPVCVISALAFPIREGRAGAFCFQPVAIPVTEVAPVPAGAAAPSMLFQTMLEQMCDLTPLHEGFAAKS